MEAVHISEVGASAAAEQLSQQLGGNLRPLGDLSERPNDDPLAGYPRIVGELLDRAFAKGAEERPGPVLVALENARVPALCVELALSPRMKDWVAIVEPHWGLVEQRVEMAAQNFIRQSLDRYEGVLQVCRAEPGGLPEVKALLVAREGARPVTGGLARELEASWGRVERSAFGLQAPVREVSPPSEARRSAVFEGWRGAQSRYRSAVVARHEGRGTDVDLRKAQRHASEREADYFKLWGQHERSSYGVRSTAPETRITLHGAAPLLAGLERGEVRRALERAVHQVLPRQQLFVLDGRAFGRSIDVRVHHFVAISAGEAQALRERLPAATIAAAREIAPGRVVGELVDARVRPAPSAVREQLERLARALPAAPVRAMGEGLDRAGAWFSRSR